MSVVFAGLDWASRAHAVCIIDQRGSVVVELEVAHDAAGLREMIARLRRAGVHAIAIERPSGLLVDTLVEAGFTVVPIHPNIVKATRPRYRSHGGKSDAGDAYLLADLLRTDGHRFKPLSPQSDELRALRTRVRGRDELRDSRIALANQLRSLLESFWPGAVEVFAEVDSPIALEFVQRYPTPHAARALGPKRMAAFCAKHGYSGRRSAQELLQRLRQAAAVQLGPLEMQAKGEAVLALVRTLATLVKQLRQSTQRVEQQVAASADGRILMSFPSAGRVCAAQMLAELGDVRERLDSEEQLAAEAGVSPVTYASGKSKAVRFRWACNHRLRMALTCMADNSRHVNAWAAAVYAKARGRGCDHPHAVRILARAWVRVLWRAWTDRKPYDPRLHGGLQAMLQTARA